MSDERQDLLAAINLGELLVELTGIDNRGKQFPCPCPDHDQTGRTPPVTLADSDGYQVWRCPVCDEGGTAIDALVARGSSVAEAFEELRRRTGQQRNQGGGCADPPKSRAHVHTCTLERYAAAKKLPIDFLRELGITDYKDQRFPGRILRIPYRDGAGNEPAVKLRPWLEKRDDGEDRFLWRKGSKLCLYGLWRACARVHTQAEDHDPPSLLLVEGESDCHTLWHHGIATLGLPGAGGWDERRDLVHFEGVERIDVVIEPDSGGEKVMGWLASSKLRDRAWLVEVPGGDVSALHVAAPERFKENLQRALDAAEPWRVRAAELERAERREVASHCEALAREPRILDRFEEDLSATGLVGEARTAKLIYLATTSRLFDKIVSVAVKGPSSAGKSFALQKALDFFPPEAINVVTAMSERGLIFTEQDMRHRMLVVFEAEGMAGNMQSYVIRSLLSEGRVRYQTTGKENGEVVGRIIELDGPSGLLVTTTSISLHAENETRLLSVTATDTQEQTKAVLMALATEHENLPDLGRWHALQRWITLGERRVTIPYAQALAKAVPPVAVRLRRDFGAVLGLIRAHALLHQASRQRDGNGRIVAVSADYAVVRELIVDLVSEGVGRTVKPEVREAVDAVEAVAGENGATRAQVAGELELDPSAAGRRLQAAQAAGYVRNQETSRGRPARWVTADPLPENVEILPEPESVCTCARETGGSTPPRSPDWRRAA